MAQAVTDLARRLKVWYLNGSFLQAAEAEAFTLLADLRHNDVGSWRLTTSFNEGAPWLRFSGGRGDGILLTRDDVPVMVGLLSERTITEEVTDNGGYHTSMTAMGSDALILLQDRWVDPIGGTGGPDYSGAAFDNPTGAAETLLRYFVEVNTGQTARADRRINALHLEAGDSGSGGTTTVKARFDNLLTLLQRIATLADPLDTGLAFAINLSETVAGRLEFSVRTPRDLRSTVIFDVSNHTASKATLHETAPSVNAAAVGSEGMLADQTIVEFNDSSQNPFGRRIERYVSAGGTANADEAEKKARELFADGQNIRSFEIEVADDARYQWGRDYDLGDRVGTVVAGYIGDGIVQEIGLKITGDAVTLTPRIGASARSFQTPQQRRMAQLDDRVSLIERVQAFGSVGMIIEWRRPIAEIPAGWRYCDGATVDGYQTADKRGRFSVGVDGSHTIGSTGGSATTNIAHTHPIPHDHPMAHTHASSAITGQTGAAVVLGGAVAAGGGASADPSGHVHGVGTLAGGVTSASSNANTGSASIANTGAASVGTVNTEPPWLASHFIERCPAA